MLRCSNESVAELRVVHRPPMSGSQCDLTDVPRGPAPIAPTAANVAWGQLLGGAAQLLNPLFTVTRKSRCLRQTTRAQFDCLYEGTTKGRAGRMTAQMRRRFGTGRKHE